MSFLDLNASRGLLVAGLSRCAAARTKLNSADMSFQ